MCGGYLYCRWGMDLLWWMDFTEKSPGFPDFTEKFSVFSQTNLRNYLRNLQSIPRTLQGGEYAMCVTVCGGYLYCRWGMDLLWWMGEISRFSMMRKYRISAWWVGVSTCASSVPQKLPWKKPPSTKVNGGLCATAPPYSVVPKHHCQGLAVHNKTVFIIIKIQHPGFQRGPPP